MIGMLKKNAKIKFLSKGASNVQVNLCQKLLFLHQLTHNMTTDCSLNYKFNTWKFQAQNMGRTCCVQKLIFALRTIYVHNMFSPFSERTRAFDKDSPVLRVLAVEILWEWFMARVRVVTFLDFITAWVSSAITLKAAKSQQVFQIKPNFH